MRSGAGRRHRARAAAGHRARCATGCSPSTWARSPAGVADALAAHGSLIAAVDALRAARVPTRARWRRCRGPRPTDSAAPRRATTSGLAFLDGLACDPERPAPDQLLAMLVPAPLRRPVRRSLVGWAMVVAAVAALVAVWRLTPLALAADAERLAALGRALASHPAAPAIVLAGYLAGALVFFPITLLLGATALVFPAPTAIVYCMGGALTSAVDDLRDRPAGRTLSPALARTGRACCASAGSCAAAACSRSSPRGCCRWATSRSSTSSPGALGVPFGDYMIGNAIGLLPGVLALTMFADRLGATVRAAAGAQPHRAGAWSPVVLVRRRCGGSSAASPGGDDGRCRRPARLRVASYNIHECVGGDGRRDPARIARRAARDRRRRHRPAGGRRPPGRHAHVDADAIPRRHAAACTRSPARRCSARSGHYGNALLTRRPVLDVRHVDLTVYRREPRGAIDVDLDIDGAVVRVLVTHLGLLPGERRTQVRRLLDVLGRPPLATSSILCGDINEWFAVGRPLRWLHARLGRTAGVATFPAAFPVFALDRIWVHPRPALAVADRARQPDRARGLRSPAGDWRTSGFERMVASWRMLRAVALVAAVLRSVAGGQRARAQEADAVVRPRQGAALRRPAPRWRWSATPGRRS